ncbi:histidine kinase dimerization/phospho-acceptor domain-containing protein [Phenylobacterium sp. J367]|uniref:histidine kinase dimerization/phospho-acceptor domain-containing protein n=1 Tax=Phenylobacterium sp. J367 TaxID=2898435 RepID=UPI0021519DDC|nr:histidine kinase dimerization/phospho-acceptor domain-containing protein [Phenylobacterium sp. J367]MCR5878841.1 hypothetical protein [Phenylobacterium sp. J367]
MPKPASMAAQTAVPANARAPSAQQARRDQAFEDQKRSFLRMVSHELRTPLNSILGFSDILASGSTGRWAIPTTANTPRSSAAAARAC